MFFEPDGVINMSLRISARCASGLMIIAGFIAAPLAPQDSLVPRSASAVSLNAEVASGINFQQGIGNACDQQNWPYYSNECLRGERVMSLPRQVDQQTSTAPMSFAPVIDVTPKRKPDASRAQERHQKARQRPDMVGFTVGETRTGPPLQANGHGLGKLQDGVR
jgi:hypothetical protein